MRVWSLSTRRRRRAPRLDRPLARVDLVDVGPVDAFRSGANRIELGDESVLVIRSRGGWHAILNQCPHLGYPLDGASIAGCTLTCLWHGGVWRLDTGTSADPRRASTRRPLIKLTIECRDGRVLLARPQPRLEVAGAADLGVMPELPRQGLRHVE